MQASLFRMPEEAAALQARMSERPKQLQLAPKAIGRKRDSERDVLRFLVPERPSGRDLEPAEFKPSRKYPRVESSASAVNGKEDLVVDAGLSLGRSFRAGWGPSAKIIHLGQLCSPLHDANSTILLDADGVPFANPSSRLSFASFAALFTPSARSFEPTLFRLGHALFDELDLHLQDSVSVDVRNRIYAIRRKAELSAWLEDAVAPAVDGEIKHHVSAHGAEAAFSLLTGHQVEQACEATMESGEVKLATLISQAEGDYEFLEDLRAQLRIWREDRVDVHINANIRKVYALLAGIVDILEGSNGSGIELCPDLLIAEGLDWKRVFGLHLWYAQPMDASIADVFESYEQHWKNAPERAAPPRPWYAQADAVNSESQYWRLPSDADPPDALYHLMKLYADPACSLSNIMSPLSFGPSPLDYSLPWHLYIILSRCMRIRDFADRDDPGVNRGIDDDETESRVEGHSPSADLLTGSYASQLEQMGLIQEAVFVLLHIEGSSGREKAIKDLLARSAPLLDDWVTRGLAGSLKIPLAWVNEAKAIYALDSGDVYDAYILYLQAGLYQAAHDLAVIELAPEAVIRDDLQLLRSLFDKIAGHPVDGWHVRGKAFLDYAHVRTRVPELLAEVLDAASVPDASQASELEEFARMIPRLVGILPDILRDRTDPRHNTALAEMIAGLTRELDKIDPLALSQAQAKPMLSHEATKLRHLHCAAHARFLKTLQAAAAA
ncbi:hypothetical protein EWM64_g4439 [Hericium alpestre]|uniref:Nuclear pore complex protein NUP96 C-terminal domain-containing protein n=1 Tax=Hericium alpestre TaxID=135208 RepID=A0A4Y9ZXQ1_9AGAM|nr:hypothetical protein EWM64_g4439 [Hericium alpestre]